MNTEKRVTPVSEETRYAIKRKSAYALPSNPSERGMSAEEIKKAFYAPVTETANSVLSELDRVIQETNEVFEEAQGDRSDKLEQAKQYTDEREAAVRSDAAAENAKQDRATEQLEEALGQVQEKVDEHGKRLSTVEQTLTDTVLTGIASLDERKTEKVSPMTSGDLVHTGSARIMGHAMLSDTTVEGTLSNSRLHTAYEDIENSKTEIIALRAELSGKGRIFSLPDFASLVNFLQYGGRGEAQISLIENGTAVSYTASELKTGDVIYIKEVNVPDVWWIATDSEEGAYSYTYNGVDYRLVGYGEYGGAIVGQVQPLETDYMVIEQHAVSASVSAQNAASRAAEAATSAGQAAGYAAEAQEEKEEAETWATVAKQAATEAKSFAETAATHVLAAEEQSASASASADRAMAEADRAQSIVDASNASLRQELEPRVDRNAKRITNLEQGLTPDPFRTDSSTAYVKDVPATALPYAEVTRVGGVSYSAEGEILDAKVIAIECVGKNFMTAQDIFEGAPDYKTETADGRSCVVYNSGWSYQKQFFNVFQHDTQYTVTFEAKSVIIAPGTVNPVFITLFYSDGTGRSVFANARETSWTKYSLTSDKEKTIVALGVNSTTSTVTSYLDINTFQIEKNTQATEYSPCRKIQYLISEAVQAIDGYGCGVNSTYYNSIEWGEHGNAVFHKLVSPKITLCGSSVEDWKQNNGWGQSGKNYFAIRLDVNELGTGVQKCLVSSPWIFAAGNFSEYDVTTNYGWFIFYTSAITTIDEWKTYLQENPVELVFALATAESIDISNLITSDNLIAVEAGGTVTMVNEYGLAVPSEITYMLKEESE